MSNITETQIEAVLPSPPLTSAQVMEAQKHILAYLMEYDSHIDDDEIGFAVRMGNKVLNVPDMAWDAAKAFADILVGIFTIPTSVFAGSYMVVKSTGDLIYSISRALHTLGKFEIDVYQTIYKFRKENFGLYPSLEDICKALPEHTEQKIKTIVDKLIEKRVIVSVEKNKYWLNVVMG